MEGPNEGYKSVWLKELSMENGFSVWLYCILNNECVLQHSCCVEINTCSLKTGTNYQC